MGTIYELLSHPYGLRRFGNRLSLWGQVVSWYDLLMQRRNLAALDDHLLRDIGVTREQRDIECRKSIWSSWT